VIFLIFLDCHWRIRPSCLRFISLAIRSSNYSINWRCYLMDIASTVVPPTKPYRSSVPLVSRHP